MAVAALPPGGLVHEILVALRAVGAGARSNHISPMGEPNVRS